MTESIKLTDPADNEREVDAEDVTMVFFSAFLSPPAARSNLIYQGSIRSFKETPLQAVKALNKYIKLLKLTLPNEQDTLMPDIWVNIAKIQKVNKAKNSTILKLTGQKGTVEVTESKEFIDDAIDKAAH